ncbi:MAG: hypothetical protein AB1918_06060 [Pseudomonadota bacterium]
MDARGIGLILIWLGTIALVAVLMHRIRTGAWSVDAFDTEHPVGRWSKRIAVAGMVLAALGTALTVWGVL